MHSSWLDGSSRRKVLTAVYFFAYVSAETLPPMFGPSLTSLNATTSVSEAELLQLPSILSIGAVVGGLSGGFIFDAPAVQGSFTVANMVLVVGLLATAIANCLTPTAGSAAGMNGWTLLMGTFNGLFRV
jgi:hypothetical protein